MTRVLLLLALLAPSAHAAPIPAIDAERERIRAHLQAVERTLRARDVSHLPPALRAARRRNLDALRAYWRLGEFPHNRDFPGQRMPYWIDAEGRACAMAHLVLASGGEAAASAVRERENNAFVRDMTSPELLRWLAASGLTLDEAAWIQPTYCFCDDDAEAPVCGRDGKSYYNGCVAEVCAGEYSSDREPGACNPDDELLMCADVMSCPDGDPLAGFAEEGCQVAGRPGSVPGVLLVILALLVLRRRSPDLAPPPAPPRPRARSRRSRPSA